MPNDYLQLLRYNRFPNLNKTKHNLTKFPKSKISIDISQRIRQPFPGQTQPHIGVRYDDLYCSVKNEDSMQKTLQIALVTATGGAWIVLALMIVRQSRLLAQADPTRDTGISFGYVMLTNIGIPALLGVTIVVSLILSWMNRRHRIQAKSSAIIKDESK